jgi:hypothetical protein
MSFLDDIFSFVSQVGNLPSSLVDVASQVGTTVLNTTQNILSNPLPTIETIALTTMGVPYPIAAAAVNAANGGDVRSIALSAASAYAGSQIGAYAGAKVPGMENLSKATQATISSIVASSSGSAAAAALSGKSFDQVLQAGAAGAVAGLVGDQLKANGFKPGDIDTKLITNAATSASKAIMSGKSIMEAVTNSTVATLAQSGMSAAANSIKQEYDNIIKDSSTLQGLQSDFNGLKQTATDFFSNTLSSLQGNAKQQYEGLDELLKEIDPIKQQTSDALTAYNTNLDHYNNFDAYAASMGRKVLNTSYAGPVIYGPFSWKGNVYGPDWAIARDATNIGQFGAPRETVANSVNNSANVVNNYVSQLQPLVDKYTSSLDSYNGTLAQLNDAQKTYTGYVTKLNDMAGQSDILAKNIADTSIRLGNDAAVFTNDQNSVVADVLKNASDIAKDEIYKTIAPAATLNPGDEIRMTDTGEKFIYHADGTSTPYNDPNLVNTGGTPTVTIDEPNQEPSVFNIKSSDAIPSDAVKQTDGSYLRPSGERYVITPDETTNPPGTPVDEFGNDMTDKLINPGTTGTTGTGTTGTGTAPVTNPPVTNPPVPNPSVTEPTVPNPPVTEPTVPNPPVTNPVVTKPPVTNPVIVSPPPVTPPATTAPVTSAAKPPTTQPEMLPMDFTPHMTKGQKIELVGMPSFSEPNSLSPQQQQAIQQIATPDIVYAAQGGLMQHFDTGGDVLAPVSLQPRVSRGNPAFTRNFTQNIPRPGMAMTGLPSFERHADGGEVGEHNPEFFSEGGLQHRYVTGDGDGTSDSVPAMLANGEFVIPADVVASLGNGSNEAGALVLNNFLSTVREHKQDHESSELPPDSKGPLSYLAEAKEKADIS